MPSIGKAGLASVVSLVRKTTFVAIFVDPELEGIDSYGVLNLFLQRI
jgi:hypothetical protein